MIVTRSPTRLYAFLLAALALLGLACSLINGAALGSVSTITPSPPPPPAATRTLNDPTPQPLGKREAAPDPTPSPGPALCLVHTGQPGGALTLRTGPGVDYPPLAWPREGETLTITQPSHPAAWIQVQAGSLTGWVYSKYCEVQTP